MLSSPINPANLDECSFSITIGPGFAKINCSFIIYIIKNFSTYNGDAFLVCTRYVHEKGREDDGYQWSYSSHPKELLVLLSLIIIINKEEDQKGHSNEYSLPIPLQQFIHQRLQDRNNIRFLSEMLNPKKSFELLESDSNRGSSHETDDSSM
ncbi:hypothetical protein V2J09_017396 [Rumex salicifolius]